MSSHGMSEDEVEVHSESNESNYAPEAKTKRGDHDNETQTTSSMASTAASINCPSTLLEEHTKGPFDCKSPLKQFSTKLPSKVGTFGCTRL